MLVAQKDAITRITGIITPESIDRLENELGGAFTKLKSTHFATIYSVVTISHKINTMTFLQTRSEKRQQFAAITLMGRQRLQL
jgi:hypothetical protein